MLRARLLAGLVAFGSMLVFVSTGPSAVAQEPEPSTIAVIGDIPYTDTQLAAFPSNIGIINADPDVSLAVHLGDIKSGSTVCSDSYFATIKSDFDLFSDPLVYTPGDNEWTDCHRPAAGGFVPTERLAKVRQVFFPTPGTTLGVNAVQVSTQASDPAFSDYVENTMWSRSGVIFATLDIPGSNNDLAPWFGVSPISSAQQAEFDTRLAADIAWLNQAFNQAKKSNAAAVTLLVQADMWDLSAVGGDGLDGYDRIVARIATLAIKFGRPVLILEGDSHLYRVDHPFVASDPLYDLHPLSPHSLEAPNVTRIVVDGQNQADDYLKLQIDPDDPDVFSWTRCYYASFPAPCPVP